MPDPEPVDAPLWLGIDLGTQGVRAVLVDGAGTVLGSGSAPLERDVRDGDRHEQDPAEWWRAACAATRAALAARGDRPVGGVSIDSTSGTLVVQDAQGRAAGPALMYDDRRAAAEAVRVQDEGAELWTTLGYRIQASWALPKVVWLAQRNAVPAGHRLAHQADHIGARLAGHPVPTDWSHALKTGYDLLGDAWPDAVLDRLGIDPAVLPPVVAPGERVGRGICGGRRRDRDPDGHADRRRDDRRLCRAGGHGRAGAGPVVLGAGHHAGAQGLDARPAARPVRRRVLPPQPRRRLAARRRLQHGRRRPRERAARRRPRRTDGASAGARGSRGRDVSPGRARGAVPVRGRLRRGLRYRGPRRRRSGRPAAAGGTRRRVRRAAGVRRAGRAGCGRLRPGGRHRRGQPQRLVDPAAGGRAAAPRRGAGALGFRDRLGRARRGAARSARGHRGRDGADAAPVRAGPGACGRADATATCGWWQRCTTEAGSSAAIRGSGSAPRSY